MRRSKRWYALFASLLMATAAGGQTVAAAKAETLKEAAVLESRVTRVTFQADGTGNTESTGRLRIESEAGVQAFGLLKFNYAKDNDKVEIGYVRVRKPDGSVVTTPADNVQDMPGEVTRVAPLYSDLREIHVAVRGLAVGDQLEFQVRTNTVKPQVPGQFWYAFNFTKDVVCQDEQLEIRVPKDKYVQVKSHDVQPTVTEEGGYRVYLWKTSNPSVKEAKKSGVPTDSDAPPPSVELTTFHNWAEIGQWYESLQRERVAVTPDIRAKALELTKGLSSDEQKTEALYQFVSGKFRYIALSFGIGRYQPHAASDVLANEYGDCKDKHTLFAALLKAVGIQAWPALINTERRIEADLPSPAQFDHMITAVQHGGDIEFLDTTPGVSPFGLLLTKLRDREALVMYDTKPSVLVRTPAVPPFSSDGSFTSTAKLGTDGVLTAHMERRLRGDAEVLYRLGFRNTPPSQWKQLAQQVSYSLGYAGTVSNVDTNALQEPRDPFRLTYDYKREGYADWADRRTMAPLPPMMASVGNDEEKPKDPILLGAPGEMVGKARMELPAGYTLTPPAAIDLKEEFAEYHSRYQLENGTLVAERRLVIKRQEVSPAQWEAFKKFSKIVWDDYADYIDLKSTSGESAAAKKEKAESPYSPETAQLLKEGLEALQARNFMSASDYLQQLVAVAPRYPGAWAAMGTLQAMQNRPDDAIESFQKELSYHPDNREVYRRLAQYQFYLKRRKDAADTWRKFVSANPEDEEGLRTLGQILVEEKGYNEAAGYLERAEKSEPDNATLKLLLGTAYMGLGERDKAVAELDRASALDPSPSMLNNVAYSLADSPADLPRALEYGKKAVAAVESETQKVYLDDLKMSDLNRMGPLSAYWDTVGWIYYKSNDLEQAEAYLKAAWALSQDGVEGDHLGQVYEKKGDLQAAARMYELALERNAGPETKDRLAKIREKVPAAKPKPLANAAGKPIPIPTGSAGEELSRLRTTKVGVVPLVKNGSAEFFLLLTDGGKVEAVKFISGKVELGVADQKLLATHFDQPLPPGSHAKIIRRGILSCSEYTKGCDFVALNLEVVRSLH